jgi:hypothetical protein
MVKKYSGGTRDTPLAKPQQFDFEAPHWTTDADMPYEVIRRREFGLAGPSHGVSRQLDKLGIERRAPLPLSESYRAQLINRRQSQKRCGVTADSSCALSM